MAWRQPQRFSCGAVTTQVIVLNGGSNSGKSGIARCLQAILPDLWLAVGGRHADPGNASLGVGYPWPWSNRRQPAGVLAKHRPHGCQPVGMVPSELPCVYISNSTHSSLRPASDAGTWSGLRPLIGKFADLDTAHGERQMRALSSLRSYE